MADIFVDNEHELLKIWEDTELFSKIVEKNKGHVRFRFLDGPVTANNRLGIHHAWGRSIKDILIRYKTMRGYECRYQYGFDSQGLWVEVEVEKQLGFKTKKDIEAYGLDKFTRACVDRVKEFSGIITQQSKRLGMLMDEKNPYFTNTDLNIQGIWHFLKKCHENGWIEQEYKPMPWCPRCGTSLSEHEMTGSYKMLTHDSVYVKLPVIDRDFKLLVWTTTPWTLSANAAFAVNPELDYVKVKVKSDDKPIVCIKNAISHLGDDKEQVLEVFKGSELVGLTVETCFPEFDKQKDVVHKIHAWEDVTADDGTGVVHIAPGCGIEDFELGSREGIAQIMPIDDGGVFLEGFGFYTGKKASEVAPLVFEELEKRGKLYKVEPIEHSYPVCWRCHSEVLFRLVPAWYIRTAELKPRLIKAADSVKWDPASSGKRMDDWLTNMGDWNISRKRYYGMPLPFYKCDCGELTVIGSKDELREKAVDPAAVDALPELHRPWIDGIKIKCPRCGKPVDRVSEIGDVWMDAGIVPFSTMGYFDNYDEWLKNYPAEWIVEMHEQIRLWFYSILFMSVVLEDRSPFERASSHSAVVAEDGSKFHKTGYMIKLDEAQEKLGSDAIRYLYAGAPLTSDVRFGYNLGEEARRKLLNYRNIYTFFSTYSRIDKPDLNDYRPDFEELTLTDRWLLLRTNEFISTATEAMEDYKPYLMVRDFEAFVDDISNWYIRVNRRRFWKTDDERDKLNAYWTLFTALKSATGCMAPVIPFMTDEIWRD
nr:isoleucine--tRNA ligase [Clostridia bacterium]